MKKIFTLLFLMLTLSTIAQEEEKFKPTMKFKGFTQLFFSASDYEDSPYGFTIRRLRIVPHGNITKNISYKFQFGYDKYSPSVLDALLNFKIRDEFQVQAGLYPAPGARSGAFGDATWSTTKMNVIQRSMHTQNYNTFMKMKGYRDIGVQVHGHLLDKKLYYATMIANPNASDIFTPGVKTPAYSHSYNGIKSWTRLEFKPIEGMGIGGFVGVSSFKDSIDNQAQAYGGHFVYRSDNIRAFAELVAGSNNYDSDYVGDFDYMGMFVELGYVINGKFMPVVGFDRFQPNTDGPDGYGVEAYNNLTIGCSIFIDKSVKLMANYILRMEERDETIAPDDIDNNLFLISLQYIYKQGK